LQCLIVKMENSRKRAVKSKRFDSLQYLKYAIHNSWSLRPKTNPVVNEFKSNSQNPVTKIKATAANGSIFYYSVQDTVFDEDSEEDEDDDDDDDEIIDHLGASKMATKNERNVMTSFDEFASDLDLNNVSALNASNPSSTSSNTSNLDELVSALESQVLTLSSEVDAMFAKELPKINIDDFHDNASILELYEDFSNRNSELLNIGTSSDILDVLQKSVESDQEYLTFSINPTSDDLTKNCETKTNERDANESAMNAQADEYVTLSLEDISNNVILPELVTHNSDSTNFHQNSSKDVLLTENVVQFADINEFLDANTQCSTHQWSTVDEFLQDFNALTIE